MDYDENVTPGEAVLLNGQSTYAVASSSINPYSKPVPLPPPRDSDRSKSLYAHGGLHGWDDTARQAVTEVDDCPTCRDTQLRDINADDSEVCFSFDSEVCFTEELVRRKLMLARSPPSLLVVDSQYDRVPISSASTEVVMRTFKGLPPCSGPCPPGRPTACWTSAQTGTDHGVRTTEPASIQ